MSFIYFDTIKNEWIIAAIKFARTQHVWTGGTTSVRSHAFQLKLENG